MFTIGGNMWESTYSKVFDGVKKEKIWGLWTDIDSWPGQTH